MLRSLLNVERNRSFHCQPFPAKNPRTTGSHMGAVAGIPGPVREIRGRRLKARQVVHLRTTVLLWEVDHRVECSKRETATSETIPLDRCGELFSYHKACDVRSDNIRVSGWGQHKTGQYHLAGPQVWHTRISQPFFCPDALAEAGNCLQGNPVGSSRCIVTG